ncbi:MAG: MFS transporter [Simkaniaceae bacterium]|nr:MFS transporter [Simkaniaceae bacterium]MCF7852537.1 MFS transporter [Simkaniaceae bacterium]
MTHQKPHHHLKWLIWSLAALFYFYEFVLRVSPSVIVNNLMFAFSINASAVGIISAFYLYAYAPMQLPVGILIDRYGVKKLLSTASLICGIGAMVFAFAFSVNIAALGRFLIGAGSAFAFVSMVYISSHWFDPRRRAFLIGLANSIAMLGASSGGGPLASLIQMIGWRTTIFIFGVFGIILSVGIYWSLSEDIQDKNIEKQTSHKKGHLLSGVKIVATNWRAWINSFIAVCFYITTTAFAGLWGVPFVQTAYGVSKTTAGYAMSTVFMGWLIGGPIIGIISDFMQKRLLVLRIAMLLTCLCLSLIIYCNFLPIWVIFICAFLIGLFSSAELLNFTISIEINPSYVKATAIAFTNFIVSMGDSFIQPFVGMVLDMRWTGQMIENMRIYSVNDYKIALTPLPIALIIGFLLSFIFNNKSIESKTPL